MSGPRVSVVVGVDGAGRTHRLDALAADANGPVVRITTPVESSEDLAATIAGAGLVVVDDAHRLDAPALRTLTAAARRGVPMAIARRPTILAPELAELDEAVSAQGRVEVLAPLSAAEVETLLGRATGRLPPATAVAATLRASGGLPAIAVAIAGARADTPAPALLARVQRRLATMDGSEVTLVRILALRLDLDDHLLANAADAPPATVVAALRELRDGGLLDPGDERMIPAVAEAVLVTLAPAERRRVHDAVARALVDAGGDPIAAATQLRAARARTGRAAEVYRAAGERLCFADPVAAAQWFDDAIDAGAEPATVAPGRAEAAALLGLPVDLGGAPPDPASRTRVALVEGAVAAHQGRAARAADALLGTDAPGPVLAVPALMAIGRPDEARLAASADAASPALRRLAEAALAVGVPEDALPLFIEAAEAAELAPPAAVLPDTPHALGAVVAVAAGDAPSAEHLLGRALAAGVGGPVAAERHRLLLAWVRLRAGRYDTAVDELRRVADTALPGRENLLASALSAGLARRSGDIAHMRDAWVAVEPVLARRAVDLFQLEAVEELAVAATRLRRATRVAPVLDALRDTVERLGRPEAWLVSLGWIRLQAAIADDDQPAAAAVARSLAAVEPGGARQRAQRDAALLWADALAGEVDADAIGAATEGLAAAGLPWEASRLAGQAAIRTGDPAVARRLLERARDLGESVRAGVASAGADVLAALSEREVEVARLVVQGRTYKEIGSQLFIAPKTVEHHVARIRTKVGATDRAEFLAALRELLDPAI